MARQSWLANELRRWGLTVVEHSGWQVRGSETFGPKGVVAHHTAGPLTGDIPSLRILIHGRADLPGPLCQIGLGRSGTVHVIAAGRANHAGRGGWNGLSGNSSVFGIEAENTGRGEPWTFEQLRAYVLVCAALCTAMQREARWVCGHKEWRPGDKIDPHGIDMNWMRREIENAMAAGPGGVRAPEPKPEPEPVPQKWVPESGDVLSLGEFGPRVKDLQHKLSVYFSQNITVDGYYGGSTRQAVMNVQMFFKVEADGKVGPQTWGLVTYVEAMRNQRPPEKLLLSLGDGKKNGKQDLVRELQSKLNRVTRAGVWEDGEFGAKTDVAVKNFQRFFKMTVDGIVGPKTWGLLDYLIAVTIKK